MFCFNIIIMKISIPKIFTKRVQTLTNQGSIKKVMPPDIEPAYDDFKLNVEKAYNFDSFRGLTSVSYYPYIELKKAIMDILRDKVLLKELSKIRINPRLELQELEQEILKSEEIGDMKIKSLIGYGYKALVFETESGKVIKITRGDHFNGRQPADFDLPIEKSGKLIPDGEYYYYIEDKVSRENIGKDEVLQFIKQVKQAGYRLKDCREDGLFFGKINAFQFGRVSDGKIYLIDPECAQKIDPNESFITKMYHIFFG